MNLPKTISLVGQTVLVTGAGGAIGAAAARACGALGAQMALADVKAPHELANELKESGLKAVAYTLDNTQREQVAEIVRQIGRIDALCDCSGYYRKGDWAAGADEWESVYRMTMDVNLLGPFNLVRTVLPGMLQRSHGRIALTASMAARNAGTTMAIDPAYVASKGALQSVVRYFAKQVADKGIVVNAVSPGPIRTPLLLSSNQTYTTDHYPMKRLGSPDEIAWPLAFLCSGAVSFMTGAVIDVNGGMAFT